MRYVSFLSLALALTAGWPAAVPAQDIRITELLAVGGGLADEDGDFPDWIEIQNRGASAADLDGWYLTDDAADLRKWRFPSVTVGPGDFLVVFASGKDRATSGHELHTSFQLSAAGEFLALVRPDGVTAQDGYAPEFPQQYVDISYGVTQDVTRTVAVTAGTTALFQVPSGEIPGGWVLPGFDDSSWSAGELGAGYDSGGGVIPPGSDPVNVAPGGSASQSSLLGGFSPDLAIDGDYGDFTHTAAGENLPATWELDLGDTYSIASIVLHNRSSCCQSRLRDITVSVLDAPGGEPVFTSDLLNPENVLGGSAEDNGPATLTVDLVQEIGGPINGRVVRVVRTPDPDLSGSGGGGNSDEADVLSLGEVEVFEGIAGYRGLIATDVGDLLEGVDSSLYLRIPFEISGRDTLEFLTLRMKYDDGFVAYINGSEVARRNAPASTAWNSTALAERPDEDGILFEDINISEHLDLLHDGTNILAIQALHRSAADDDFVVLPELVGTSVVEEQDRYFREPTPGLPNDTAGVMGFVADTKFSHDRGYYESPFQVEITTATEGAVIRYTLDGTPPTPTTGTRYTGPVLIDQTTTLSAAAFRSDLEPTNVDTQTYIFVNDVVAQDYQTTLAAGFPSRWGGTSADYGMDSDVIGPNDLFGGEYAATIRGDLKSLPALSIVMKTDDLFGGNGIYTNSGAHGEAWERPASVELVYPDGRPGFQVNCGIRIQGGYFRSNNATRKHSFRLLFKRQYGATRLRFPLFGPGAADRFDTITLRAGANDGYSWDAARLTEQYTRDQFGRSLQRATGNPGSHGMFVHLYLNGIYWGLYNPLERPDHAFSASYLGGEKEDWDSVHDGSATNGSMTAWNDLMRQTSAAGGSLAEYQKLQGRNPDGTPNPAYPNLLDVTNYVDYILVNVWGGNWDWPTKNFWAGRYRGAESTGFKFYCWDFENTMGNNRGRSPLSKNALTDNNFSVAGQPHRDLRSNPEYKLLFADRAQRFLFNGGVLTPESLIPRYAAIAAEVERAIVCESARWGDQHFNPPLTLAEWKNERDWILGTYLPQRSDIVLGQLRAAGLYPPVDAPAFNRQGGDIDPGFHLLVSAAAGTVYYTLDGRDPRLPGGGVAPWAMEGGAGESEVFVEPRTEVRVLVPLDDSLGLGWTLLDFDDGGWMAGLTGVGYETGSGYEDEIETDVESAMHDVNSSVYLRIPFNLDAALFEGGEAAVSGVTLEMKYDDGFVAYVNGVRVASRNAPADVSWDSGATVNHADNQAVVFESVSLEAAVPALRPGRNVLAIHGLNTTAGGSDFLIVPQLEAATGSSGIVLRDSTVVKARALDGDTWSALNEATFAVDTPLRVTEVMYHPAPAPAGSDYSAGNFEFVELENVGDATLDLNGLKLSEGIEFEFSSGRVKELAPGQLVVVVRNEAAFSTRYNTSGMLVAGEYAGQLSDADDRIVLEGRVGETILDFSYDDAWYPVTDGGGPSLVVADPAQVKLLWGKISGWRPSDLALGSPGVDESAGENSGGWQLPGDVNQDAVVDLSDGVALLGHLFLGDIDVVLPCGDGAVLDEGNQKLLDSNGDRDVGLSDAIYLLNHLFLGGPAPALGTRCVLLPGCPDACGR